MRSKFKYLLIISSIVLFTGSDLNYGCNIVGEITGIDATRCVCCGGWKIKIGDQVFMTDSIPNRKEILGLKENIEYPIPIYLDYEKTKRCRNRILITCIKKRK